MKKYKKLIIYFVSVQIIMILILGIANVNKTKYKSIVQTNSSEVNIEALSNKKIGWGIKRADNHERPDVGSLNKNILDKYDGMCIGNEQSKNIYLTFDEGYEAGYNEKILEVLKQNDVKACFFITAHYVNTQPELVKKMIDAGHIVGNHTPRYLMSGVVA